MLDITRLAYGQTITGDRIASRRTGFVTRITLILLALFAAGAIALALR